MNRAILWLVPLVLTACGGTVVSGSEQGNGGTGGTQGECEPLPCPYPGWDPETCACKPPPQQDAAPGPDAGSEAAADAPHSKLVVSIVESELWMNCMPEVPADPMSGTIRVRYDNSQGPAVSVVVESVQLQLPDTWSFQVTQTDVGTIAAGSVIEVDHEKIANTAEGPGNPCQACGAVGQLRFTWKLSDGQTLSESKSGMLQCAW